MTPRELARKLLRGEQWAVLKVELSQIPAQPTHAIQICDSDCEVVFLFAYAVDGVYYSYDTNRVIKSHVDEILKIWELS